MGQICCYVAEVIDLFYRACIDDKHNSAFYILLIDLSYKTGVFDQIMSLFHFSMSTYWMVLSKIIGKGSTENAGRMLPPLNPGSRLKYSSDFLSQIGEFILPKLSSVHNLNGLLYLATKSMHNNILLLEHFSSWKRYLNSALTTYLHKHKFHLHNCRPITTQAVSTRDDSPYHILNDFFRMEFNSVELTESILYNIICNVQLWWKEVLTNYYLDMAHNNWLIFFPIRCLSSIFKIMLHIFDIQSDAFNSFVTKNFDSLGDRAAKSGTSGAADSRTSSSANADNQQSSSNKGDANPVQGPGEAVSASSANTTSSVLERLTMMGFDSVASEHAVFWFGNNIEVIVEFLAGVTEKSENKSASPVSESEVFSFKRLSRLFLENFGQSNFVTYKTLSREDKKTEILRIYSTLPSELYYLSKNVYYSSPIVCDIMLKFSPLLKKINMLEKVLFHIYTSMKMLIERNQAVFATESSNQRYQFIKEELNFLQDDKLGNDQFPIIFSSFYASLNNSTPLIDSSSNFNKLNYQEIYSNLDAYSKKCASTKKIHLSLIPDLSMLSILLYKKSDLKSFWISIDSNYIKLTSAQGRGPAAGRVRGGSGGHSGSEHMVEPAFHPLNSLLSFVKIFTQGHYVFDSKHDGFSFKNMERYVRENLSESTGQTGCQGGQNSTAGTGVSKGGSKSSNLVWVPASKDPEGNGLGIKLISRCPIWFEYFCLILWRLLPIYEQSIPMFEGSNTSLLVSQKSQKDIMFTLLDVLTHFPGINGSTSMAVLGVISILTRKFNNSLLLLSYTPFYMMDITKNKDKPQSIGCMCMANTLGGGLGVLYRLPRTAYFDGILQVLSLITTQTLEDLTVLTQQMESRLDELFSKQLSAQVLSGEVYGESLHRMRASENQKEGIRSTLFFPKNFTVNHTTEMEIIHKKEIRYPFIVLSLNSVIGELFPFIQRCPEIFYQVLSYFCILHPIRTRGETETRARPRSKFERHAAGFRGEPMSEGTRREDVLMKDERIVISEGIEKKAFTTFKELMRRQEMYSKYNIPLNENLLLQWKPFNFRTDEERKAVHEKCSEIHDKLKFAQGDAALRPSSTCMFVLMAILDHMVLFGEILSRRKCGKKRGGSSCLRSRRDEGVYSLTLDSLTYIMIRIALTYPVNINRISKIPILSMCSEESSRQWQEKKQEFYGYRFRNNANLKLVVTCFCQSLQKSLSGVDLDNKKELRSVLEQELSGISNIIPHVNSLTGSILKFKPYSFEFLLNQLFATQSCKANLLPFIFRNVASYIVINSIDSMTSVPSCTCKKCKPAPNSNTGTEENGPSLKTAGWQLNTDWQTYNLRCMPNLSTVKRSSIKDVQFVEMDHFIYFLHTLIGWNKFILRKFTIYTVNSLRNLLASLDKFKGNSTRHNWRSEYVNSYFLLNILQYLIVLLKVNPSISDYGFLKRVNIYNMLSKLYVRLPYSDLSNIILFCMKNLIYSRFVMIPNSEGLAAIKNGSMDKIKRSRNSMGVAIANIHLDEDQLEVDLDQFGFQFHTSDEDFEDEFDGSLEDEFDFSSMEELDEDDVVDDDSGDVDEEMDEEMDVGDEIDGDNDDLYLDDSMITDEVIDMGVDDELSNEDAVVNEDDLTSGMDDDDEEDDDDEDEDEEEDDDDDDEEEEDDEDDEEEGDEDVINYNESDIGSVMSSDDSDADELRRTPRIRDEYEFNYIYQMNNQTNINGLEDVPMNTSSEEEGEVEVEVEEDGEENINEILMRDAERTGQGRIVLNNLRGSAFRAGANGGGGGSGSRRSGRGYNRSIGDEVDHDLNLGDEEDHDLDLEDLDDDIFGDEYNSEDNDDINIIQGIDDIVADTDMNQALMLPETENSSPQQEDEGGEGADHADDQGSTGQALGGSSDVQSSELEQALPGPRGERETTERRGGGTENSGAVISYSNLRTPPHHLRRSDLTSGAASRSPGQINDSGNILGSETSPAPLRRRIGSQGNNYLDDMMMVLLRDEDDDFEIDNMQLLEDLNSMSGGGGGSRDDLRVQFLGPQAAGQDIFNSFVPIGGCTLNGDSMSSSFYLDSAEVHWPPVPLNQRNIFINSRNVPLSFLILNSLTFVPNTSNLSPPSNNDLILQWMSYGGYLTNPVLSHYNIGNARGSGASTGHSGEPAGSSSFSTINSTNSASQPAFGWHFHNDISLPTEHPFLTRNIIIDNSLGIGQGQPGGQGGSGAQGSTGGAQGSHLSWYSNGPLCESQRSLIGEIHSSSVRNNSELSILLDAIRNADHFTNSSSSIACTPNNSGSTGGPSNACTEGGPGAPNASQGCSSSANSSSARGNNFNVSTLIRNIGDINRNNSLDRLLTDESNSNVSLTPLMMVSQATVFLRNAVSSRLPIETGCVDLFTAVMDDDTRGADRRYDLEGRGGILDEGMGSSMSFSGATSRRSRARRGRRRGHRNDELEEGEVRDDDELEEGEVRDDDELEEGE
ncbi:hypothetical protein OIY81_3135, partial [Cryptosporidium canis]